MRRTLHIKIYIHFFCCCITYILNLEAELKEGFRSDQLWSELYSCYFRQKSEIEATHLRRERGAKQLGDMMTYIN